ncbi:MULTISPECIES: hypothetical protein [Halocynthiibacter]|uniref:Uncharacterized protein n=1 Tax=Halocynthiibacter halioticoli TaxID=2986804 RepID=A0AAE3LQF6_9RHOB|nr:MULTISPECIES: hypothetical protein [Halocynthiibacter]MCV6823453.1 hypothetical protein [Halocynthiibacter halioticoli]MCW4056454.1 hypothetical protein [Halocynthiibacter sp. SDUM655004]
MPAHVHVRHMEASLDYDEPTCVTVPNGTTKPSHVYPLVVGEALMASPAPQFPLAFPAADDIHDATQNVIDGSLAR